MTTETSTHAQLRKLSYAWPFPFTHIIRGWFVGSGGVNKNSFIRLDRWISITSFNNPKKITRTSVLRGFTGISPDGLLDTAPARGMTSPG
ncbi:hypothetical protein Bca4012_030711 [Brassica carinata]|uniref:Uncharacterized protein n=2 Tax=Brassica TaxID=3705 RepID=A0A3P6C3W2_BRAOL|nr:unnamed protein product [Brassica napus]VDD08850.1 unnamed protein product [Brassica oleracea]